MANITSFEGKTPFIRPGTLLYWEPPVRSFGKQRKMNGKIF